MEIKDIIEKLMQSEKLTKTEFASKIGVQRSNINHILEGRSKPGFDFLLKTVEAFPSINTEWLITGNGHMYKKPDNTVEHTVKHEESVSSPTLFENVKPVENPVKSEENILKPAEKPKEQNQPKIQPEITKNEPEKVSSSTENTQNNINTPLPDLPVFQKPETQERKIETVIIFYTDGTCKSYKIMINV